MPKTKLPGVRVAAANQQLLVSSGHKILDDLFHEGKDGGGIPVGSIFVVREFGGSLEYSTLLLKYFLSQGVEDGHGLFLCCPECPHSIIRNLPSFSTSKENEKMKEPNRTIENLQIAWRYKDKPSASSCASSKPSFDIKVPINKERLDGISYEFTPELNSSYASILNEIYSVLTSESSTLKYELTGDQDDKRISILRILIIDFGSLLYGTRDSLELKRFIISLKSLCRNYLCTVCIQVHGEDSEFYESLQDHVDTVIDITAFKESGPYKKIFKNHHGMIRLERSYNLHRLNDNSALHKQYLFKSMRNGFSMEIMTLPPDFTVEEEAKVTNRIPHRGLDF